jgi:class 3 adenylate cyclase
MSPPRLPAENPVSVPQEDGFMNRDKGSRSAAKPTAPPTAQGVVVAVTPSADRTRTAWLAHMRQELEAPVSALLELTEMLLKDSQDRGQAELLADVQRIHTSAKQLRTLSDDLLDPTRPDANDAELGKQIRHDLRNPLNHIIGYSELWLEDAHDLLLDGFASDLQQVRTLGQQILARLDQLLAFSEVASDPDVDLGQVPLPAMIRELIRSLPSDSGSAPQAVPDRAASVLVVDDNEVNRDLLSRLVRRDGHSVSAAADGKRALELLRSQPFDLVLLDIIMPELNGFQVLERLKTDPSLRHVPVIMISAFDEFDGVVRCIQMGAEDYLPKPFNAVLLKARMSACLEKKRLLEEIRREQQRADDLLHVILPREIAAEMKCNHVVKPRRYENVAVLFSDVVGFTPYCAGHEPEQVVQYLNQLTETWEEIALRHQVEKIKTIGDAFMGAAGLLWKTAEEPVLCCIRCGLEMIEATHRLPTGWNLRVGIHVGPVVAGVMGKRQYLFDLWGDTVNTAARMESHGIPGSVALSSAAWQVVADQALGESRGMVSVKGRGEMEMIRFVGFRIAP